LCDLPLGLLTPLIVDSMNCQVVGSLTTFFIMATCSWYCLIAYDFYKLLHGYGLPQENTLANHLFVWIPSIFAAVIAFAAGAYGHPTDHSLLEPECWYVPDHHTTKLALILPIAAYMFFSLFLLIKYFANSRNNLRSSVEIQQQVGKHLAAFTGVFCFTWICLVISFFDSILPHGTTPNEELPEFDILDDICFLLIRLNGLFNYLVWIKSPFLTTAYDETAVHNQDNKPLLATQHALLINEKGIDKIPLHYNSVSLQEPEQHEQQQPLQQQHQQEDSSFVSKEENPNRKEVVLPEPPIKPSSEERSPRGSQVESSWLRRMGIVGRESGSSQMTNSKFLGFFWNT